MLIFLDFQENRPECSSDIYAQRYNVNIPKVEIFPSKSFLRVSLPLLEKASYTLLAKLGYLYFMVSLNVAEQKNDFPEGTLFSWELPSKMQIVTNCILTKNSDFLDFK